MKRSRVVYWAGRRLAHWTERMGLRGWVESLRSANPSGAQKARYAQDASLSAARPESLRAWSEQKWEGSGERGVRHWRPSAKGKRHKGLRSCGRREDIGGS